MNLKIKMFIATIKQFIMHISVKIHRFLKLFCRHKHCVYDTIELDLGGSDIKDSLITELLDTKDIQVYTARRLRCIDCGKILSIRSLD